jgi:hypothetical protein
MNTLAFKVFGWVVHRVRVEAGESFGYEVRRATIPSRLSAQTIYTKGRCTGHYEGDEGRAALERVPGFANDRLPSPLPALRLSLTAQEASEWWCLSAPANPTLPLVEFVRLLPKSQIQVDPGDLIFICEGQAQVGSRLVQAPKALRVTQTGLLVAGESPVYGLKLSKEGPLK